MAMKLSGIDTINRNTTISGWYRLIKCMLNLLNLIQSYSVV